MTDFYDELAQDALDLIDEFGRDVQHASNGTEDIVPGKPWRGVQPIAPTTVKAAIFDATSNDRQAFPDVDFTKRGLIAAKGLVNIPAVEDRVIDDITYRIARVVELKPGPTALVYTVLLSAKSA